MTRRIADWMVVARRELLERIRTKWFVIVTLLGPLGMVALIVVPALLAGLETAVRLDIVDHTGRIGPKVVETLRLAKVAAGLPDAPDELKAMARWNVELVATDTTEDALRAKIRDEVIDGFLVIPADGLGKGELAYQGDNGTNPVFTLTLRGLVTSAVQTLRAEDQGLTGPQLSAVLDAVRFRADYTNGESEATNATATFLLGYIVMFIIYMAIILYASNVLRSVVLEKTSRVAEIMVAAAKPRALMFGKIAGVGLAGILQLSVWLGMGALSVIYRDELLGVFGASGGFSVPAMTWSTAAVILGYFLGGYFFYASIYCAIGAMVSSDQEAQQAQTPVVLLLVIPVACVQIVANDPRGTAAAVLTQIPFSSPVLMPMRYLLGGATPLELAVSIAILSISTYIVAMLAARIYRVGLLMYGKRPSLRELARWLRY